MTPNNCDQCYPRKIPIRKSRCIFKYKGRAGDLKPYLQSYIEVLMSKGVKV